MVTAGIHHVPRAYNLELKAIAQGWSWVYYETSRPRDCWILCPPGTDPARVMGRLLHVFGPLMAADCEIEPALPRIGYHPDILQLT